MAKGRMIPTQLLWDPDFNDLSEEAQLVMLKLTLIVDDHGRGRAHLGNLARQCNKDPQATERALQELETRRLLLRYTVDGERYFLHRKWSDWQTLNKPARPKYPAPPQEEMTVGSESSAEEHFQGVPGSPVKSLAVPGTPQKPMLEVEVEVEVEEEIEKEVEEEKEDEVEGERRTLNVVPFPTTTTRDDGGSSVSFSDETITRATHQAAHILKISLTPALTRVVAEFLGDPAISLLGEADAAREWIDDPRRNKKRKLMTPAFFRSWLKREADSVRQKQQLQATGTTGTSPSRPDSTASPGALSRRNLMDLEREYQAAASVKGANT